MTERKLAVLIVADVSPLQKTGGSVRVLKEQACRLAEQGHSVTVLSRHPGGEIPSRSELGGARVLHYDVDRSRALFYATTSILGARKAFRNELAGTRWDVILFHQPFSASGVLPRVPRDVRRLYCFHSPAGDEYRLRAERALTADRPPTGTGIVAKLMRRLERRALERSNRIVVLSGFSRHLLQEIHGIQGPEVVTISGGVDLEHFHPAADRGELRSRLSLPRDGVLLLTVRDLEPRMGIDLLLEALSGVETDERVFCVVGGTGPLRAPLERRALELGLGDTVRFVGHIPEKELPLYYQTADLFVLPTRTHEGFGLVTVEALACGTPVVGTPAGATPEIIGPLDSRFVAPEVSAPALTNTLSQVLALAQDDTLRRRCRAYAEDRYSWERHVGALERELLSLGDRSASRALRAAPA